MSDLRAAAERLSGELQHLVLLMEQHVETWGDEGVHRRVRQRMAAVAKELETIMDANPADGGEPWDLAWLFDQGADVQGRFDLGGAFYIQFYRSDMSPTLNHEYPGAANSTLEEYIDLAPCPTKGDVRRLLAAMGYKKEGGATC